MQKDPVKGKKPKNDGGVPYTPAKPRPNPPAPRADAKAKVVTGRGVAVGAKPMKSAPASMKGKLKGMTGSK